MGKFFKELKNQSRPKTVLMEMFSYIKIFSAAILIAFVLTRCVIVNAENADKFNGKYDYDRRQIFWIENLVSF